MFKTIKSRPLNCHTMDLMTFDLYGLGSKCDRGDICLYRCHHSQTSVQYCVKKVIISTKSFFYSKGTEGRELKLVNSLLFPCYKKKLFVDIITFLSCYFTELVKINLLILCQILDCILFGLAILLVFSVHFAH